jgi:hypothetical protein
MTSPAGTDPHPEVTEISDFSERLLPAERAAAVEEHLSGCDLCADVLSSLDEIRGLLGTLPGPVRMPDDVAERINAAIAAEAVLDAARHDVPRETLPGEPRSSGAGTDVPRGTSSAAAEPEPHPQVPAPAGPAPAGTGSGRPPGHARGSAPQGPQGQQAPSKTRPGLPAGPGSARGGRRRARRLIAAAYAVTALALGGIIYGVASTASPDGGSGGGTTASSTRQDTAAGTSAAVDARVHQLLAAATPPGGIAPQPSATGHGNAPMTGHTGTHPDLAGPSAVQVPSCVLKATHRSEPPLATGREPYQGSLAYLLVLPHPGDSTFVDAFLVNASCTGTTPGAVLFQGTYSR